MSIKQELEMFGFSFNKNFGQNFITDKNLLSSIVSDSELTKNDVVLEIGTGAGTLTSELIKNCKQVFSFEIDQNLKEYLENKFKDENNVNIIFKDFLKVSDVELNQILSGKIKVVANLPYYITTPIIFKLLNSELDIESLTLMVQKEVAERIIAKPKTKDYGELSVVLQSLGEVKLTRVVPRTLFTPQPKVDSAIIKITPKQIYNIKNRELFLKTVRACFFSRRKTLVNNLSNYFSISKSVCEEVLKHLNLNSLIRGEELEIIEIIKLSEELFNNLKSNKIS